MKIAAARPVMAAAARALRPAPWTVAVLLLVAIGGSQAFSSEPAQPRGSAHLSAVSDGSPWRRPPGIAVETRDTDLDGVDGPFVVAVRETIHEVLTERGVAVAPDGSHVLHFMVSMAPSPAPPDDSAGSTPPARIPPDRYRSVEVEDQVTVPLYRLDQGGVSTDMTISFILFVPGEAPIWQATITAAGEVADPAVLAERMTRAALNAFGGTEERTFDLGCANAAEREAGQCLP